LHRYRDWNADRVIGATRLYHDLGGNDSVEDPQAQSDEMTYEASKNAIERLAGVPG
jgi:hypothetical protein